MLKTIMNTTDFIIILFILLALFDGWRAGFFTLLIDLAAFLIGLAMAFAFSVQLGNLFGGWLNLSVGLRPFLGFALIFLVVTTLIRLASRTIQARLLKSMHLTIPNRIAGATLNVAKQALALAVMLNLFLFLPIIPFVRRNIQASRLAPYLLVDRPFAEGVITRVIAPAVFEAQDFLTTKTISDESVTLHTPVENLTDDRIAEQAMLLLVNHERSSRGLLALAWNEQLAQVARLQSRDMWRRQYFAHINPDGADPFARLHQANINYLVAGENLALAPNTTIAHKGLMDSPEHKDNILASDYSQIGIGVVRNALYGEMFTQEFTN